MPLKVHRAPDGINTFPQIAKASLYNNPTNSPPTATPAAAAPITLFWPAPPSTGVATGTPSLLVPPLPPEVVVTVANVSLSLPVTAVTVALDGLLVVLIPTLVVETTTSTEPSVVSVNVEERRTDPPSVLRVAAPPGMPMEVEEGARQPEIGPRLTQALADN